MKVVVEITHWGGKKSLECFSLTKNHIYEVLNQEIYNERKSSLPETESKKVFDQYKDDFIEKAYGYGFSSYKEVDTDWHDEAIEMIKDWQTECKKPLYVLLTSSLHGSFLATQYSFDKKHLDGIAAAINAQADGWGCAKVEKFDSHIAEWYMPEDYVTK